MNGHLLFWISIGIWISMESYVFFGLNKMTNKVNEEKKSKLIIVAFILLGIFGSILIDLTVVEVLTRPFNGWRYLSIPLILTGVIIRICAIRQLGASFSVNVGVLEGTHLKQDGLYKLVRHPSYLGEVVIFLGVAVVFFHPVTSIFAFVFPTFAFLYRIHLEEQVLIKAFGQKYKNYQKQTKKIIPYIY